MGVGMGISALHEALHVVSQVRLYDHVRGAELHALLADGLYGGNVMLWIDEDLRSRHEGGTETAGLESTPARCELRGLGKNIPEGLGVEFSPWSPHPSVPCEYGRPRGDATPGRQLLASLHPLVNVGMIRPLKGELKSRREVE